MLVVLLVAVQFGSVLIPRDAAEEERMKMPLIYSFVARDTTILAEYTPYTGKVIKSANFSRKVVGSRYLERMCRELQYGCD